MEQRTWVVAFDFSPCAQSALELAAQELSALGAGRVVLVHAFTAPFVPNVVPEYAGELASPATAEAAVEIGKDLKRALQAVQKDAQDKWPELSFEAHVVEGPAYAAILAAVKEHGGERLVVGSHGHTGFKHVLLGSVSSRLARLCQVPVLVVKAPETVAAIEEIHKAHPFEPDDARALSEIR